MLETVFQGPAGWGLALLSVVTAQRLIELRIAKHNTERLLAKGAREIGADHYPLMVGFHATWLVLMWIFGWNQGLVALWVVVYALLQVFRIWILASLGSRWTTRIIILDEPLVARGPYKFIKHPNYWLVVAEIATVPLALGLTGLAVLVSIAHAGVLFIRIRAENVGLKEIAHL
ncbi:MAG: isoprenylcysteine carboxyl methyltransferase family protein [Alphaproteobacteria bacterium]